MDGTNGDDEIRGTGAADVINGLDGNDRLFGRSGADTLDGGLGDDVMYGGDDDDTFYTGGGSDRVNGNAGDDRVYFTGGGSLVFNGGDGIDTLDTSLVKFATSWRLGADIERFQGGAGAERVEAAQGVFGLNTTLFGAAGADTLIGAAGEDLIDGGSGNDFLSGGDSDDTINGGKGDDHIDGGSAVGGIFGDITQHLSGGEGQDVVTGGDNADVVAGGDTTFRRSVSEDGDVFTTLVDWDDHHRGDLLRGGLGDDLVLGSGGDSLDGGEGQDAFSLDFTSDDRPVEADLTQEVEGLLTFSDGTILTGFERGSFRFGGGADHLFVGDGGAGQYFAYSANGGDGDDTLVGGEGDESLSGAGGRDTLRGGSGGDILAGGENVEVPQGDGIVSYEYVDAAADVVDGGDGADTIFGGAGDTLIGNLGIDVLHLDLREESADYVIDLRKQLDAPYLTTGELSLSGFETGALWLGAGDDRVALNKATPGIQSWSVYGGAGADRISGNSGADDLYGDSGADDITGGAGDDFINGVYDHDAEGDAVFNNLTDGGDLLDGGRGDDFITAGWNDSVIGGKGRDYLSLELQGLDHAVGINFADQAAGGVTHVGMATIEGIERLALSLTDFDDRVTLGGGLEAGMLLGGGNDRVEVLAGTYSAISVSAGEGADIVRLGNGVLAGSVSLDGGEGKDVLHGAAGADYIAGGAGSDTIVGGAGGDSLFGSGGGLPDADTESDTFRYRTLADSSGEQVDFIYEFDLSDVIDLAAIDAKTSKAGDQAFKLVDAFTGVEGQLTVSLDEGGFFSTVAADVDGDGVADLEVRVVGDLTGYDNFLL